MLINCPNCNSVYDIDEKLIPETGKKLRCAKCGKVWLARLEDMFVKKDPEPEPKNKAVKEEQTPAEAPIQATEDEPASVEKKPEMSDDLKGIFERLAAKNEEIFKHDKEANVIVKAKAITKETLGIHGTTRKKMFLAGIGVLALLVLFYFRYEIVRSSPFMDKVYSLVGIDAHIPGYGLEFQNVMREEYEEDGVAKLGIKGFIVNSTGSRLSIPDIHVEMLDKQANLLQSVDSQPPLSFVPAPGRIAFRITIDTPSSLTKYILLTFKDTKKN